MVVAKILRCMCQEQAGRSREKEQLSGVTGPLSSVQESEQHIARGDEVVEYRHEGRVDVVDGEAADLPP